jgi:hypothetical protein
MERAKMSERCKACGMPLPPVAIQHRDDFCSTECARQHYGGGRAERTPAARLHVVGRGRIVSLNGVKTRRAGR